MQNHRTIITTLSIFCGTIFLCFLLYFVFNYLEKSTFSNNATKIQIAEANTKARIAETESQRITTQETDKFTHCIQIVMSEARQSSKPIDAQTARSVCLPSMGK